MILFIPHFSKFHKRAHVLLLSGQTTVECSVTTTQRYSHHMHGDTCIEEACTHVQNKQMSPLS